MVSCGADHAPLRWCSSPGWKETPRDVSVLVGDTVRFKCRSSLSYREISWIFGGRPGTGKSSKLSLSKDRVTATYGPVDAEDDGLAMGCEILSSYGKLPSPLGTITVHCKGSICSSPAWNT